MGLTLRRTALPDAKDDYTVHLDGDRKPIGRIYLTPNRTKDPWLWSVYRFPASGDDSGYTDSLEAAKAAFRNRWEALFPG